MKEYEGKILATTLEELVHPKHTALLVVDVQNDFCAKGGVYQKRGKYLSRGDAIIIKLQKLLKEARRVGVKIVFIENTTLPNSLSDSAVWLRFKMIENRLKDPHLIPKFTLNGTWGQQVVDELEPQIEDFIIKKHRSSAFFGTRLDVLLRSNDVSTCLVTGMATQGCVDSTARDAQFHDYYVVILEDCVDATNKDIHNAAIKIMKTRYDIVNSQQLIQIWKHY